MGLEESQIFPEESFQSLLGNILHAQLMFLLEEMDDQFLDDLLNSLSEDRGS